MAVLVDFSVRRDQPWRGAHRATKGNAYPAALTAPGCSISTHRPCIAPSAGHSPCRPTETCCLQADTRSTRPPTTSTLWLPRHQPSRAARDQEPEHRRGRQSGDLVAVRGAQADPGRHLSAEPPAVCRKRPARASNPRRDSRNSGAPLRIREQLRRLWAVAGEPTLASDLSHGFASSLLLSNRHETGRLISGRRSGDVGLRTR